MGGGEQYLTDLATNTSAVVTMVTSLVALFTQFPINIMIVGSLAAMAFKIFRKAKKAAVH
jgi:hypothetical protein